MKWLSTVKRAEPGVLTLERMELDENGFPQPTGEVEELEADALFLALGQEADLSLLEGVPGIEVADGVVKVTMRGDVFDGRGFLKSAISGKEADAKSKTKNVDFDIDVKLGAVAGFNIDARGGVGDAGSVPGGVAGGGGSGSHTDSFLSASGVVTA